MNKKLYNMMDWAKIEEVVYGECDAPDEFLGSHNAGRQSLIQCFFPGAENVYVYVDDTKGTRGRTVKEEVKMEMADEAGFFAAVLSGNDRFDYKYHIEYPIEEKNEESITEDVSDEKKTASLKKRKPKKYRVRDVRDIYNFRQEIAESDEDRFLSGADNKTYLYMGAHKKSVKNVRGCMFRVWAPNAIRVSVVGDFNDWNGLETPMNRRERSGIFELFVPGIEEGDNYKFEIVMHGGAKTMKADPYCFMQEAKRDGASRVTYESSYDWDDAKWMKERKKAAYIPKEQGEKDSDKAIPLNIYELPLSSCGTDGKNVNIAELADGLAKYVKNMGYSHVSLMPFMEYPDDNTCGYHPALFFAPTWRYGKPDDYKLFVDKMHRAGIGVIMQWTITDFSNIESGLGGYDGTSIYEYGDYRMGMDPRTGMFIFDKKRPEVREYLLSSLRFWAEAYHMDAFVFSDVTGMLYLDYYRNPGEWTPNMYGGVENLDTIDFLKEANRMLHDMNTGIFTIAEESSGYSTVTGSGEHSLGFDYKSDPNFTNELADYLSKDPIERKHYHQELTDSTLYQYCENYILPVTHSHLDFGQGGLYSRVNGDELTKWENLKLLFAYQLFHVGKMSTFMGQEIGIPDSFEGGKRIDLNTYSESQQYFKNFIRDLNRFYTKHPSLSSDTSEEGFKWVDENAAERNVLSFVRKNGNDELLVLFNFANVDYPKYETGVPEDGKYQEILCSADEAYGGSESVNPNLILARDEKCNGFDNSICVHLKPLSVSVFAYLPYTKEEQSIIEKRKAEKIRMKKEEEQKKLMISDAKVKIREDLKSELEKKIAEAEAKIASGSEYKSAKKKK